jgi:hypothetical protein
MLVIAIVAVVIFVGLLGYVFYLAPGPKDNI